MSNEHLYKRGAWREGNPTLSILTPEEAEAAKAKAA